MAIQIPNPGTGNGATGDNEFVLWSKVKDNFSDQTNAASKLVGTENGNVPIYIGTTGLSGFGYGGQCARLANATNLFSRTWVTGFYNGNNLVNAPLNLAAWFFIEAMAGTQANKVMLRLTHYVSGDMYVATGDNGVEASWSAWEETPLAKDVASTLTGQAIDVTGVKSGAASYKRGWRKLTGTFGVGASTITIPTGLQQSEIASVRAKIICKDDTLIVWENDTRSTYNVTLHTTKNHPAIVVKKSDGTSLLDNAQIILYIEEDLS